MSLSEVDWSTFSGSRPRFPVLATLCLRVGGHAALLGDLPHAAVAACPSRCCPCPHPQQAVGYYILYGLGRRGSSAASSMTWGSGCVSRGRVRPSPPRSSRCPSSSAPRRPVRRRPRAARCGGNHGAPPARFLAGGHPACLAVHGRRFPNRVGAEHRRVWRDHLVAANIPGETQTVPAAIYDATQAATLPSAHTLALLTVGHGDPHSHGARARPAATSNGATGALMDSVLALRLQRQLGPFVLDIDFETGPGITVLYGHSGSGKSMTLKSIAGLARPRQRTYRIRR